MEKQKLEPFYIIGISVRTTNENSQAAQDIPALWNDFMSKQVMEQIPNKMDYSIYSVYTDYEKDHTRPYTTILGCKVSSLDNIPEGLTGLAIERGEYIKRTAKGNLHEGIVYNEWIKIWNADLPRTFTADFEIYGEKSQNPADAEVDIFLAVQ